MKPLLLPISVLLLSLTACKSTKIYTDQYEAVGTENLQEITIAFHADSALSYSITDKQEVTEFITDLNNARVNGPWKGAHWDTITLHYSTGDKTFTTNGKVFGLGSSGIFYDLNERYRHYWGE